MKFSIPFKISRKGITFMCKGEKLTYSWFAWFHGEVYSHKYDITFASLKYYESYHNKQVSKLEGKLSGYSYKDIISEWVAYKFPFEHVIILTDINVDAKNITFWAKVKDKIPYFLGDSVVLRCKDKTELVRLLENIPGNFADAVGYSEGVEIINNYEDL